MDVLSGLQSVSCPSSMGSDTAQWWLSGYRAPSMDHACLQGPDTAARRQDPSATNPCSKASHADSAAAADE